MQNTLFSALLLISCSSHGQTQSLDLAVDLDDITLPTDLVAAVVKVEDDIMISTLLDASDTLSANQRYSSNEVSNRQQSDQPDNASESPPTEPNNNEPNSAVIADSQEPEEVQQKVSGSIFDNVPGTTLSNPELAAAQDAEPALVDPPRTQDQPADTEQASLTSEQQTQAGNTDNPPQADKPLTPLPQTTPEPEVVTGTQPGQVEPSTSPEATAVEATTEVASSAPVPAVSEQDEQSINEDEIILGWATAWSNNDIEGYLGYYAEDFDPAEGGLDLEGWKDERRKRLQNQDIRIIVSNAELTEVEGDQAEVRFTQRYTSKSYKDRVVKSIRMKQTPEGWKFLSERTLETLPFK